MALFKHNEMDRLRMVVSTDNHGTIASGSNRQRFKFGLALFHLPKSLMSSNYYSRHKALFAPYAAKYTGTWGRQVLAGTKVEKIVKPDLQVTISAKLFGSLVDDEDFSENVFLVMPEFWETSYEVVVAPEWGARCLPYSYPAELLVTRILNDGDKRCHRCKRTVIHGVTHQACSKHFHEHCLTSTIKSLEYTERALNQTGFYTPSEADVIRPDKIDVQDRPVFGPCPSPDCPFAMILPELTTPILGSKKIKKSQITFATLLEKSFEDITRCHFDERGRPTLLEISKSGMVVMTPGNKLETWRFSKFEPTVTMSFSPLETSAGSNRDLGIDSGHERCLRYLEAHQTGRPRTVPQSSQTQKASRKRKLRK